MARNRKNQSGAVRFVPAFKAVLLCILIGGSAVGYVHQKNQLYGLGRQITKREVMLDRLKWENNLRIAQLAKLQMPQRLSERVKEQKLGLGPSQPFQWIRLIEMPAGPPATSRALNLLVSGK